MEVIQHMFDQRLQDGKPTLIDTPAPTNNTACRPFNAEAMASRCSFIFTPAFRPAAFNPVRGKLFHRAKPRFYAARRLHNQWLK